MNDSNPLDETRDHIGPQSGSPQGPEAAGDDQPAHIGRYRIESVLGKGGFGLVYLARDEQLNRSVAIKVPHARLIAHAENAEAYLAEARTVANLDHVNIVPVLDVGGTAEFPCYVVSKYVEGTDLAKWLQQSRPTYHEAAELVATLAEALHYAHKQGLVHRDVKPGNILLDKTGKPFVTDFGLALREENIGTGPRYAGTPAYMSPEQARGEGHRVDGRSDIFSLGVVLYELLAGRTPFRGKEVSEILEQVTIHEARPLRQYDERIPRELERICAKAMAKRASDRYPSAHDLAEDLRHFLANVEHRLETGGGRLEEKKNPSLSSRAGTVAETPATTATSHTSTVPATPATGTGSSSENPPIRIVPKGLRSFDEHDADFFLELLPGPRDREGLPDSLRFWKTRIEEPDPDKTFAVGLIYGPSGCGKSSLVKAGLLPRLSDEVISVYLEATPDQTESRLLHGLRKHCPALDETLNLKQTLAALRRGQGIPVGKKVLIVLDQFEQWLHAKKEEENTELVQALRHCDGGHVQCIVMVRDDFWMAVTRFLRELEVRLLEDRNLTAVDLFPVRHAEKVLTAFGRAFGSLPDQINETTREQNEFLRQSVAGLAEEGKVICVRLALFAEMMKGKLWTPATLKEVGGTTGIGVTFLEETFSSATASPEHRYHQKAARAVLKALLPDSGTDIKGQMKSYAELLDASGYASRPRDFDDLTRILDSEIRLITPTDPEGNEESEKSEARSVKVENVASSPSPFTFHNSLFFQLTHDYLVPSLRDWLTRKRKETRRGRAELRLEDRTALWTSKPENRHLPSAWEYANVVGLTTRRNWTEPQRKMMAKAGRVQATRAAILVATLVLGIWGSRELHGRFQARAALAQLATAEADRLQPAMEQVNRYRNWADPALRILAAATPSTPEERRSQFYARLALVSRDESQVEPLLQELLTNHVSYVGVIRDQLAPYQPQVEARLWEMLRDSGTDSIRRFRAGLALASYATQSGNWTAADATFLAEQLVTANAEHQSRLREYLRPIQDRLLTDLERIFADRTASEGRQLSAANALADYAVKDTVLLARLLTLATPEQFAVLYPLVTEAKNAAAKESLTNLVRESPAADLSPLARVDLGRRRAGAAITLLRQGERESIFDALRVQDDPESLTQFVHRSRRRGMAPKYLLECLQRADALRQAKTGEARRIEDRVLFGLLLALGEFELIDLTDTNRQPLIDQLVTWYGDDPSSAIHGASGWLLRQWKQDEAALKVDQTPVPYSPDREWYTIEVKAPASGLLTAFLPEQLFYLTFVVIPAGEYTLGSPTDEPDRIATEQRHKVRLTRPIAILDREITREEFEASGIANIQGIEQFSASPLHTMVGPSWYDSVRFCRWLGERAGLSESQQAYPDPAMLDVNKFPADPDPQANGTPRNWPVRLEAAGFRLPTEAEWEVACRSGALTPYGFGGDASLLDRYGWFQDNSGKKVHVPRQQRPNLRGLFDMHGNAFEWCHDWQTAYEAEATDPIGAPSGSFRVYRGGGWDYVAASCRAAIRVASQPTDRNNGLGFRLAAVPSGQ